jgi:hypothetical protein
MAEEPKGLVSKRVYCDAVFVECEARKEKGEVGTSGKKSEEVGDGWDSPAVGRKGKRGHSHFGSFVRIQAIQ